MSSFKLHNPANILEPQGPYSHAIEIPPNSRILFVSGQTAGLPDGLIPETIEEQSLIVWNRIVSILQSADMGIPDVVKVNTFLRRRTDAPAYSKVRAQFLGSHRPAALGLVVSEMFRAEYLVEVEVVAAQSI
jgi:2-iminobutanoate/2-iminopropanoate deaminase